MLNKQVANDMVNLYFCILLKTYDIILIFYLCFTLTLRELFATIKYSSLLLEAKPKIPKLKLAEKVSLERSYLETFCVVLTSFVVAFVATCINRQYNPILHICDRLYLAKTHHLQFVIEFYKMV